MLCRLASGWKETASSFIFPVIQYQNLRLFLSSGRRYLNSFFPCPMDSWHELFGWHTGPWEPSSKRIELRGLASPGYVSYVLSTQRYHIQKTLYKIKSTTYRISGKPKASNSILLDEGSPMRVSVQPNSSSNCRYATEKKLLKYSCRLKGISGHICGLYYGKMEAYNVVSLIPMPAA